MTTITQELCDLARAAFYNNPGDDTDDPFRKMLEAIMPKIEEITSAEIKVLVDLGQADEGFCVNLRGLSNHTGLHREICRGACRSLKEKGFATYERGLFCDDEYTTAGSGYGITPAGRAWLRANGLHEVYT